MSLVPVQIYNPFTTTETSFLRTLSDLAYANGDTLYYNGGAMQRLPKGSDGQVLTLVSGLPTWSTPSSGGTLAVETPSGTQDGSNTSFTVSNTPVFLTVNGQVLTGGGVDYSYSAGTITLITAPFSTDVFRSYHN